MHGAIRLVLKTEDEAQARERRPVNPLIMSFILVRIIATPATLFHVPHVTEAFRRKDASMLQVEAPRARPLKNAPLGATTREPEDRKGCRRGPVFGGETPPLLDDSKRRLAGGRRPVVRARRRGYLVSASSFFRKLLM